MKTLTKYVIIAIVAFGIVGAQQAVTGFASLPHGASSGMSRPDLGATPAANLAGRIVVVKPIFSDTAYSNAFYVFYSKYAASDNVTTDLNLFNVTLKNGWGWSYNLLNFLSSDKAKQQGLFIGDTVKVIDEVNVTLGGLFRDGKRAYDVVILGFTEYVTTEEYYAYKDFVATGGTLIIMDACNFLAQVRYYPPTNGMPAYLSLVKGHGWEFNGTVARKSVYARWPDENTNWIGGNYWHFWGGMHYDCLIANASNPISANLRSTYGQNIQTRYGAHEENLLQNLTDSEVIGYWHLINPAEYPGQPIAAYQHKYMNGSVFHSGIMASDRVSQEEPLQAFLVGAIRLALTGEVGNWRFPADTAIGAIISYRNAGGEQIVENGSLSGMVYCTAQLNTTSINVGGVTYGLSSVRLRVFERMGQTVSGYLTYPTQTIVGNRTDPSGLNWEIAINTTNYPDDMYKFEVVYDFVALVDDRAQMSVLSASVYYAISNSIAPLLAAIAVVALTFASVALLAYGIILLDRRVKK